MSYRSLLDKTATIMRVSVAKDVHGVVKNNPTTVNTGSYPCAVSKSSSQATQNSPQNEGSISYMVYLMPGVDVRAGDLAVVPGVGKLRLAQPYHVRGHHIEVSGVWEGDV